MKISEEEIQDVYEEYQALASSSHHDTPKVVAMVSILGALVEQSRATGALLPKDEFVQKVKEHFKELS